MLRFRMKLRAQTTLKKSAVISAINVCEQGNRRYGSAAAEPTAVVGWPLGGGDGVENDMVKEKGDIKI